jgi:hypothetical protein
MCYKPDITGSEEIAITDGGTIKKTTLADALGAAKANPLIVQPGEVLTYHIPTDFPDLPAAFDELSRLVVSDTTQIHINIESGHLLTKGLKVEGGNWARFRIISEDAVVYLDPAFVGVSDVGLRGDDLTDNLIMGYNAWMPTLGTVIDMGNAYGNGYYGVWNCRGFVLPNCGVIGAGHDNLVARTSQITAYSGKFDRANNSGIRAAHGGMVSAQSATADDCCIAPDTETNGAIDISRQSEVWFRDGSASRSGANGVNCRRNSRFGGEGGVFDDCKNVGIALFHASTATIWSCSIQRTKGITAAVDSGHGLLIASSARATAFGSIIKNSGADIGGVKDVQFGSTYSSSRNGGGTADLTFVETTSGPGSSALLQDISLPNLNFPYGAGIAFVGSTSTGPLASIGTFSSTGSSSGKAFGSGGNLESSRGGTSSLYHHSFYNTNGEVGSIKTSGTSTSYNTTSDETLKSFLGALSFEQAGAIIQADPVRRFAWICSGEQAVGWGAQTSHAISPDLASPGGWFDADEQPVPEGTPGAVYRPWSIDQSKRTPYLWAAVAGLIQKVATLEEKLNAK